MRSLLALAGLINGLEFNNIVENPTGVFEISFKDVKNQLIVFENDVKTGKKYCMVENSKCHLELENFELEHDWHVENLPEKIVSKSRKSPRKEADRRAEHKTNSDTVNRKKRDISAQNTEWLPEITGFSPNNVVGMRADERFEIYGNSLFPKHSDPLNGKFMEVVFIQSGVEYPCNINTYWSNDDRIVCKTTSMPYSDSNTLFIRYYDERSTLMVPATSINRHFYSSCPRGCNLKSEEDFEPQINFFGNRFVNGRQEDNIFFTEWYDQDSMYALSSTGRYKVKRQGANGNSKHLRPVYCDWPVGLEVRDSITKGDIFSNPDIVLKKDLTMVENAFFVLDWTVGNWSVDHEVHFEYRYKCDRNVQVIHGNFKDQFLPKTDSPSEGTSIPKMVSSKDKQTVVGTCLYNFNGVEFPSDMVENRDDNEASIVCRAISEGNFHGGVNFHIESDEGAQFFVKEYQDIHRPYVKLLNNDLSSSYNSYIAPAITGISGLKAGSLSGGNVVTIHGNKFTEKPVVKIGFQNCNVLEFTETKIVCELQESDSVCENVIEYPGNPGLRGMLFEGNQNERTLAAYDINEENEDNWRWTSLMEDGFVASLPQHWLGSNRGTDSSNEYSIGDFMKITQNNVFDS